MLVTATKTEGNPVEGALSPKPGHEWKEIIEPVKPFMDQVISGLAEQVDAFNPEIAGYARYALTNQGKQLRPALVALSGAATGKVNDSLVTVAVIIEMIHLATLVHDDVMDEAQLRRRRPTLAANWGNEISVLLGDCLFAHALSLAASFPTPEVCRAVALATNTVCSGEILQTHQRRNFALKREDYFKAVEMKTGELFALSCDMGSWLAGANPAARASLRAYGLALGTAYQIYDDCLDLFGSEDLAGKSLGTDLANGKLTLPLLIVLEKGTAAEQMRLKKLVQGWDAKNMPAIFELLSSCHALTESCRVIHQYLEKTRTVLEKLPKSDSLNALLALSDFLAQQIEALGV